MPTLPDSRHERFAQAVAKGVNHTDAYIKAGFAKKSARQNAARLITKEYILSRIRELQARVSDAVVAAEIRRRTWRVQQLQDWADDMLALRAARKKLYGKPDSLSRTVANAEEEAAALAEGFELVPSKPAPRGDHEPEPPEYPKPLAHRGYHLGGETGMLVKDYRGKNAEQEIWKFDAALVEKFCNCLKQAAIEEGQWMDKRDGAGVMSPQEIVEQLNHGRRLVAEAAKAKKGEPIN